MSVTKEVIVAGPLALELTWNGARVASIGLDWAEGRQTTEPLSPLGRETLAALETYAQGRKPAWPDLPLDYSGLTPFALKVLTTLKLNVDWGVWTTYGQLADMAGRPGAARAVGGVMAANPWPLLIPCHRVLGANKALGGFSGAGLPMKSLLLQLEGITP